AAGIERIILNLKRQKIAIPALSKPTAFIAYLGERAKIRAIKLASELRQGGITVIATAGDRSLKGQLRQANSLGASYAIIIGEREVETQPFKFLVQKLLSSLYTLTSLLPFEPLPHLPTGVRSFNIAKLGVKPIQTGPLLPFGGDDFHHI
ncbi:unnamed protein product, partial [marine sediment metagenome]